jgi:predicted chitinase
MAQILRMRQGVQRTGKDNWTRLVFQDGRELRKGAFLLECQRLGCKMSGWLLLVRFFLYLARGRAL